MACKFTRPSVPVQCGCKCSLVWYWRFKHFQEDGELALGADSTALPPFNR